jgi:hypothetical protein
LHKVSFCNLWGVEQQQTPAAMNTQLTAQDIPNIKSAIASCDRFIALESPRCEELRPADVAETLRKYIAHRANLIQWLSELESN